MSVTGRFPLALLVLALAACQALPTRSPLADTAPVLEPAPTGPVANDSRNAIAWQQTSVEYRLVAGQTWRSALAQLDKALKSPDWDALAKEDRETPARGLPPAVIVDVDGTVLDDSTFQARLIRDDKAFAESDFRLWVQQGAATPVPGAVEFAKAAAARGVSLYYVSNRSQDLHVASVENLRRVGFPISEDSQFLGKGSAVEACVQNDDAGKGCRRRLIGRTHRVLMQVGDQLGDLVTIPANTRQGREQAITPYLGWIGERWFVLPNPGYGSWLPALFDNDSTLPQSERRRRIQAALRYGPAETSQP